MRINFLLPNFGFKPSGGFSIIYKYANELAKRDYLVTIIHSASVRRGIRMIPGWVKSFYEKRNENHWFKFDSRVKLIYVPSLNYKYIPDADVTIATACETSTFLNNYPINKGIKVYFIQGYETWAGSEEFVLSTWKFDMKKIFISKDLIRIACEHNIDNFTYIPNAIDIKKYKIYTAPEKRIECISFLASTNKNKGLKYAIEAFEIIKQKYPNYRFIGFAKEKKSFFLPCWIEYHENPSQEYLIKEIYNKSQIFVCSSIYEGWGLPPMEAMACGNAIVTTNCGGINDFCIANENALICETKNGKDLADKIELLITDGELRKELVDKSQKMVKEFDWRISVDRFEKTIIR